MAAYESTDEFAQLVIFHPIDVEGGGVDTDEVL